MEGKKKMKLVACSSSAAFQRSREIRRIRVRGFDTSLPKDDLESTLRYCFSNCGEITDIYIPMDYPGTLRGVAFIYFVGEGADDNAMQLHGFDVGGWNVFVEPDPFPDHANDFPVVSVRGYDTSLSETQIKKALRKFFSPLAKIERVYIGKDSSIVDLSGEEAAVTVPELDGSCIRGCKVTVELIAGLEKSTVHPRSGIDGMRVGGSGCLGCRRGRV